MSDDHGTARIPNWLANLTGAAPAQSALALRLVLATFGFFLFTVTAVLFAVLGLPTGVVIVAAIFAAIALVDIVVISRRLARRPESRRPESRRPE
jgi:uncharacterized membrane protein YciS (DUF1049 family)